MIQGKESKLQKVVKGIRFDKKKNRYDKKNIRYVVRLELIDEKTTCEIDVKDRTIIDLLRTMRENGVAEPVKSFKVETLTNTETGSTYEAIVMRVNNVRETIEQYFIPFNILEVMGILLENTKKDKGAK